MKKLLLAVALVSMPVMGKVNAKLPPGCLHNSPYPLSFYSPGKAKITSDLKLDPACTVFFVVVFPDGMKSYNLLSQGSDGMFSLWVTDRPKAIQAEYHLKGEEGDGARPFGELFVMAPVPRTLGRGKELGTVKYLAIPKSVGQKFITEFDLTFKDDKGKDHFVKGQGEFAWNGEVADIAKTLSSIPKMPEKPKAPSKK